MTVMTKATGASKDLKAIQFGDIELLTEVREGFAVNLIIASSSAYIKEALRLFKNKFESI
jgi:hypothetical protein